MSMSPAELVERRLIGVCSHLNRLHARLVDETIILLETGAWSDYWGYRSLNQWLTIKAGLSKSHAADVIRLAKAAESHPTILQGLRDSRLTLDQAAVAVRCEAVFEAQVATLSQMLTVAQIRKLVRSAPPIEPDAEPAPEPAESTSIGFDRDCDVLDLRSRVAGERGRTVERAMSEVRDALFNAGQTDVTWTDALVEMAQRSLDAVTTVTRRDRFRAHLHLNLDPVAEKSTDVATWADGQRLPDAIRDLLLCDTTVTPEFWRNGKIYSQGRTKRVVPEWMRHYIERRDRGCRVPGCCAERWVEIHHIIHWLQGGETDPVNLVSLCPHHHRMHHDGDLQITGDPEQIGGLRFASARGQPIGPAPPPPPAEPLPALTGIYRPPLGERLRVRDVTWNHPDLYTIDWPSQAG